jgi:hypothetical protein
MGTHNRPENGRGAWVALCAHPTHADTKYFLWNYMYWILSVLIPKNSRRLKRVMSQRIVSTCCPMTHSLQDLGTYVKRSKYSSSNGSFFNKEVEQFLENRNLDVHT